VAPPRETEPSYSQLLIMRALAEKGTCKAELSEVLADRMTAGDLSKQVERLVSKGLVRLGGMQPRRRAPASRMVILTDQGRATRDRYKGV
jgi:DNA-binding MarR family transcriptional regulator